MSQDGSALLESENLRFLEALRDRVTPEVFATWCKTLKFDRPGADTLRVLAPNPFVRDWLDKSMRAPIEDAFTSVRAGDAKVVFEVREAVRDAQAAPGAEQPAADARMSLGPQLQEKGDACEEPGPDRTWVAKVNSPAAAPRIPPNAAQNSAAAGKPVLPRLGYAEANFTRLPFALVNDKEIRTAKEILIDVTMRSPKGLHRKLWRVTPGKSGMPGPFDHGVFRALERHALDSTIRRGLPLNGPVFFHLRTIIEMLGLYYGSRNIKFVSNAFDRLQEVSFEEVDFMRRANPRAGKSRGGKTLGRGSGSRAKMHLIDRIRAAGDMVRDGLSVAVSGTYGVTFGQEYEDSVNARYLRPLDWELWSGLSRPVARRLVEILDMDFYGLRNGPHVAYEYGELCGLLPAKPQRFLSKARECLDPAHDELAGFGYMTYEWETKPGRTWRILYKPGPRYWEFQRDLGHGITIGKAAQELAKELGEPGRGAFYQQIVDRAASECINEALQDLRAAVREGRAPENKAAWFLGALKAILAAKGQDLFPLI